MFAPDYGVPQRRTRCFFLASRIGSQPTFPLPTHSKENFTSLFDNITQYVSAWEAMSDLPEIENGGGELEMLYTNPPNNHFQKFMRQESVTLYDHKARDLKPIQLERIQSIKAGQGLKDLPIHLRPKSGYSGAYGRLDFTNVAPTITRWVFHPGSGRYGHPKSDRLITIREAARLQTFTDDFRFTGTYIEKAHQIGNAVPPMLMYHLASKIKELLSISDSTNQSTLAMEYAEVQG